MATDAQPHNNRLKRSILLMLVLWSIPGTHPDTCLAYVYPEHRRIAAISIQDLNREHRALLERLWSSARTGFETRMSPSPVDTAYGSSSTWIDLAAWPAISGDHSCSAHELLSTVTERNWIFDVHRVAAVLEQKLGEAGSEKFKRTNALRNSDLRLLSVDPSYATRAGANSVHFLLPRPTPDASLTVYLAECLRDGVSLNAIGVYARHHHRALEKARRLAMGNSSGEGYNALVRAMLADECFGIHFLEDAFASGHVAGSWGGAALRKGTHDYYNENGIAVTSWRGDAFVVMGDAWMREEDAARAARIVRTSFEQLLDACSGVETGVAPTEAHPADQNVDTLNVCTNDILPWDAMTAHDLGLIERIIQDTPIPGLDAGVGELPRFRAELGPFIGVSTAIRSNWHRGGFLTSQSDPGYTAGIEIALRFGIGLDGVMNESGDGLMFLDLGLLRDAASSLKIDGSSELQEFGAITSAIPSRAAYFARLRMPFWLLPFDLLLAAPVLAFADYEAFTKMGIVAANGGLLGWQSGLATSFGRFQIILGREVGVSFYGTDTEGNRVLAYPEGQAGQALTLLDIRSVQLTFPVLDYRNFRTFSRNQSSGLHIQLYAGVDIPTRVRVVEPAGGAAPPSGPIWIVGIRASLDWRYYF